jgi:membrane-associated protease RseP (regulator of RpoE activity)
MGAGGSGPLPDSASSTELDRLRRTVGTYFPVYETRVGPQSVLFAVHADPATLSEKFDRMRRELWTLGYIPVIRRVSGEDFVEVLRKPKTGRTRLWINGLLLAATFATTLFAGALIWLTYVGGVNLTVTDLANGELYFGAPVMLILGLHELAHYAMARRRHIDASLPYFLPIPPPFLFGTLGAFVSIREPFPDKKALFDIGVAGPLAGFAASIPVAIAGLYLSVHAPVLPAGYCGPTILGQSYGNLLIGTPLFWDFLSLFVPSGLVNLSPLALAGWVGIFVTAINLLPAGQLDGGHVFRALFGDRTRFVSYGVVIVLFGLGIFYLGWWLFAILVLFTGPRHPPPLNDLTPLAPSRYAIGAFALAILITGFVLVPIAVPPGTLSATNASASSLPPPMGAAVAANLTVTLSNGDPVAHGYLFSASVASVTVPNGTVYTSGSVLANWADNSTWQFVFPNGTTRVETGSSFSLSSSEYVTIDSSHSVLVRITYSNSGSALAATIDFGVNQLCAASGSGTASGSFTPNFG